MNDKTLFDHSFRFWFCVKSAAARGCLLSLRAQSLTIPWKSAVSRRTVQILSPRPNPQAVYLASSDARGL